MADIDWLGYVENPNWDCEPGDWRQFIGPELRGIWATFTYQQKWVIAHNAEGIAHTATTLRSLSLAAKPLLR